MDRNGTFMAKSVDRQAFRVRSIQMLDEIESHLVPAFRAALAEKPAFIITTGGMGPGVDDITRECVAKAIEKPLVRNQEAEEMLARSYKRLQAKGTVKTSEINENRVNMADVPEGSICHENPMGTAPAVEVRTGETTFFLLPGVPEEMQRMFDLYVVPAMSAEGPGIIKKARHVEWPGGDESALKRILTEINRRFPMIHTRARVVGESRVSLRISLFGEHVDEKILDQMLNTAEADLRARLGLEVPHGTKPTDSRLGAE